MIDLVTVIIAKNEELAIAGAIKSALILGPVFVVDSGSSDKTVQEALRCGAQVVNFNWNGGYPKKKQWALDNVATDHDWVLMLDADEQISVPLSDQIREVTASNEPRAYDIPIEYVFAGSVLRFGHTVTKRALVFRPACTFPVIDDLSVTEMWEVEGHYQPIVAGTTARLSGKILHNDPDSLFDYFSRHNRYSDWEAALNLNSKSKAKVRQARSRGGRIFDMVPFKPLAFFLYSYVIRQGYRDGRAGFDYAMALTFYYWQIGLKTRDMQRDKNRET
jgi:glycosyltransferase involved in cell wall biosynthesis